MTEAAATPNVLRAAPGAGLDALFAPRTVAVIGASRRPGSIGGALLANVRDGGFTGRLFAVHPDAPSIDGVPAYPTIAAVPGPVDLAVIVTPAVTVEGVVRECAAAGVRGVVVISAGFAEVSPEGATAQGRIRDIARAAGMRLMGPNCMGLVNTDPNVRLSATFAPIVAMPGNVGVLSQSGALGAAVLDHARALGLGISTFVSVGNKADVSGNDLLAYWRDDPRTEVIALYLESFGNPRRFARLAPEVARRKPIVAVKSGRSAAGSRAATSHSAALACVDVTVDALFEHAGVIRTDTLEDLFDVVALLSTQPAPLGRGVGIVTNAGGPAILLADACEAHGLVVPVLDASLCDELRAFLPAQASVRNPVDMIASATGEDYAQAIEVVGRAPGVDAVVALYVPPLVAGADVIAAGIARGAGRVAATKPVLTVFLSSRGMPEALASGARGRLPSFSFPENAARALAAAARYARWRERPPGRRMTLSAAAVARIRAAVGVGALGEPGARAWLTPAAVEDVLAACGIRTAPSRVTAPGDAPGAADAIGYPVVVKGLAAGLVHRSDVGAVILGLRSAEEVTAAVALLRERLAAHSLELDGVLVQRQVEGGVEAIVGIVSDPELGPLVVAGLGGRDVELMRDVSFRLVPATDDDAADMIDRLRMRPLLDGYRGAPRADRRALVDLVQRVSALADAVPEIAELDLNPVKVLADGQGVVVVDARIRAGRS